MDLSLIANELMDILEQDLEKTPFLISLGQEDRRRGRWSAAAEKAERHRQTASSDTDQEGQFWLAICYMYQGATNLAEGSFERARDYFRAAEFEFRRQRHCHGRMAALLARGQALQFDLEGNPEKAADLFQDCERLCAELEQRAANLHLSSKRQAYVNLRKRLNTTTARLRQSGFPRLVRELDVIAGEPAYLLSDDNSRQSPRMFVDDELMTLKDCENARGEISCSLHPRTTYLIARVMDDNMDGTMSSGRRIAIRSGDRLLVRGEDGWPLDETIGFFKEPNRDPSVAIFRQLPDEVVLVSANPLCKDRNYGSAAASLQYLGAVMAILEKTERSLR
jgi:tetratricopeptide (TPR) repeat protein